MTRFLLSPAAYADLDEIWDFTAERWGVEQAERYIRQLTDACQALADKRIEGRSIEHIRSGYFKLSVGAHFVCYRLTTTGVVNVIRVLHQAMDIPDYLG